MRFHGTERNRTVWLNIQQKKECQRDQPWRSEELSLGVNWESAYGMYRSKSALQEGALGNKGGQWYRRP
jgi:hypothetical protein